MISNHKNDVPDTHDLPVLTGIAISLKDTQRKITPRDPSGAAIAHCRVNGRALSESPHKSANRRVAWTNDRHRMPGQPAVFAEKLKELLDAH